jgi:GNAT superfamily N-acetyltransferase
MAEKTQRVAIRRAGTPEMAEAFSLTQEYFETIGVLRREGGEEFAAEYFGAERGFWLAQVASELAGCVGLRQLDLPEEYPERGAKCAEIKRMYVRERFRGRGIAQKLLEAAEQFGFGCGFRWIYLDTTDAMKTAAHLYQRNGYERCDRYNQNSQATSFMRKKLPLTPGST